MIQNCIGCNEELEAAIWLISEGCHIATAIDNEFVHKGHLNIIMVDDKGKEVVW